MADWVAADDDQHVEGVDATRRTAICVKFCEKAPGAPSFIVRCDYAALPGIHMATTITLNASPTWAGVKDDYSLRYEGHLIGRIRLAESEWQWQITIPMEMPVWAQGSSKDLDGCRKAFADAWGRFLRETSPVRLERAWELERGVAARQQRLEAAGKQAS